MNRLNDQYYLHLRSRYLNACSNMKKLSDAQAEDKKLLKLESGEENEKRLRHNLAERRRGRYGLRSFNKAIRAFYRYCDEKGY